MIKKEKSDHSEIIFNGFLMSELVYWMIFDQFGTFSIFGFFSSREPMIKKEKLEHSETFSTRFLMSKLVCRMIFEQFGTFSIFVLFFINGTDHQEWRSKSCRIILKPFLIDFLCKNRFRG